MIPRGTSLLWRFRSDHLDVRRLRWTIYFYEGHPFSYGGRVTPILVESLEIATETFRQPDGQHVGTSPDVTADMPGDYKYGVRLKDLDEDRELGDEDPHLIVI